MQVLGQAAVELVSVDGGFAASAQDDFRRAGLRAGDEFSRGAASGIDGGRSRFARVGDGAAEGFGAAGHDAGRRFADGVQDETRKRGPGFAGVFGGIAKTAALSFGAAFAVVQIGGFLGGLVSDAQESARVSAITANAIRATGAAAGVTADQVGGLAGNLSNLTGVDDELIQSGANLILTFKNVKNEAGRGNDVFTQATAAAVDLSAAGFGSVQSASVQLGKALNDPIKGMAALGRSGVTFTAQQKKQIEGLVKNNDLLGAQKIILGEVQSQVGGAAAAAASPVERLNVIWGNLRETLGGALLPIVAKVADALSDFIAGITDQAGASGPLATFGQIISGIADAVGVFFRGLQGASNGADITGPLQQFAAVGGQVRSVIEAILPVAQRIYGFIASTLVPALLTFYTSLFQTIGPGLAGIFSAVSGLIAALVPRLTLIVAIVREQWPAIQETIRQVMAGVVSILQSAFSIIASVFQIYTRVVTALWDSGFGKVILRVVQIVLPAVLGIIRGVLNVIVGVFKAVAALLKGDWSGLWEAVKQIARGAGQALVAILKGAFKLLVAVFTDLIPALVNVFTKIEGKMSELGGNLIAGIVSGIKAAAGHIGDALIGAAKDGLSAAAGFLKINSPSKRAADELGSPLPEGVAFGIRRDGFMISDAMTDVLDLNAVKIPRQDLESLTRRSGTLTTTAGTAPGGGRAMQVYLSTRVTAPEVLPYLRAQQLQDEALYAGSVT